MIGVRDVADPKRAKSESPVSRDFASASPRNGGDDDRRTPSADV